MDLDQLKQEVIEEGREHPFVQVLVANLRKRHANWQSELTAAACTGVEAGTLGSLAGRAREAQEIVRIITDTTGVGE